MIEEGERKRVSALIRTRLISSESAQKHCLFGPSSLRISVSADEYITLSLLCSGFCVMSSIFNA